MAARKLMADTMSITPKLNKQHLQHLQTTYSHFTGHEMFNVVLQFSSNVRTDNLPSYREQIACST